MFPTSSVINGVYPEDHVTGLDTFTIFSPFYSHGITLIPAWISNQMPSKVWGEITDPIPTFNSATVEV